MNQYSRFNGNIAVLLAALALWTTNAVRAESTPGSQPSRPVQPTETKEQRDTRMAWWREAKFGMFIHWGVYSVPAGFYHDKPVPGIGEWIMNKGKIPCAEYQEFAKQFNPVKFNADDWVKIAKDAGVKYIVITSKHHDGFAMFCSKASKWNICDASPFARDPLKELAAACRAEGIKLGFYYSEAQDWNNGGSGNKWDPANKRDMDEYIDKLVVPQVREILTNYGHDIPAVVWWDTPIDMNPVRAEKIYKVVEELRPDIIMNNRLGGGIKGDTETPEQRIPAKGFPGRDWETCMTMNDTWGFKRDDNHWKTTETLIRNLIDIASKGGNYLLNIGPNSEGEIPAPSIERLAEVGRWMHVNGESIYGSSATIFGAELGAEVKAKDGYGHDTKISSGNDWRCTTKLASTSSGQAPSTGSGQAGKVYIHLFKWPAGQFALDGLKGKVTKAYLLADPERKSLEVKQEGEHVTIALPEKAPDPVASVLCVEMEPLSH